jgi:hypothetical protein
VLEEVVDAGQSGASLERPGMDRVRDLVAAGNVYAVLAQDRDRIARESAYHYLLGKEFEEHGTKIRALNDRGDDSPEGELTDGILDQLANIQTPYPCRNPGSGGCRPDGRPGGCPIRSNKVLRYLVVQPTAHKDDAGGRSQQERRAHLQEENQLRRAA